MFSSNFVKISLSGYVCVVIFIIWLLWRNSAAPDSLTNIGILLASMLPVLVAVLPYLKSEKIERNFQYIFLYDTKAKKFIEGNQQSQYQFNYMDMISFVNTDANNLQEASSKGLDIIETGIVRALLFKFSHHWDIETTKRIGPLWICEETTHASKHKKEVIDSNNLQKLLSHNKTFSLNENLSPTKLAIPPNSHLQIKQEENSRIIEFNNSYVVLKITYRLSESSVIQQGVNGIFVREPNEIASNDPEVMFRYYAIVYKINTELSIKAARIHAPETEDYRKWFENICYVLSKFDWTYINEQIEKSSLKKAIGEISDIKKSLIPTQQFNSYTEKKEKK
jgi:hypothetical protein